MVNKRFVSVCEICHLNVGKRNNKLSCTKNCGSLIHQLCFKESCNDGNPDESRDWICQTCRQPSQVGLGLGQVVKPSSSQVGLGLVVKPSSIDVMDDNNSNEVCQGSYVNPGADYVESLDKQVEHVLNDSSTDPVMKLVISLLKRNENSINVLNKDLRNEIEVMSIEINELKSAYNELKVDNVKLKEEIICMKTDIQANNSWLNDQEQYSKNYNVILNGIPAIPNEQPYLIAQKVASVFGCDIQPRDIEACHRLRKQPNQDTPPIIVRFTSRDKRRDFLQKRKDKKTVSCHEAGLAGREQDRLIFVNEHLTKHNEYLLYRARLLRKQKVIKYAWVSNGSIYVRKSDNDRAFKIKKVGHLLNVAPEVELAVGEGQSEGPSRIYED